MNKTRCLWIISGLILLICIATSGCMEQPQEKPEGSPKQEPVISLFVAEEDKVIELGMEEYIAGVVAAEMEPTWPVDALAAQAILARTFTMENIASGRKQQGGADASTSHEEFQAYDETRINDKVSEAVNKTRGEVMVYQGEYARGWFSACCGGVSAAPVEGPVGEEDAAEYVSINAEDGCLTITTEENISWRTEVPLSQVWSIVREQTGEDPGTITSVDVDEGPSGRALELIFNNIRVNGNSFRLAVGAEEMRSTLLSDFSISGNNLIIEGQGFGHGVGLCQWGAKKMAQDGQSPEDIIRFYHDDVAIVKLWE